MKTPALLLAALFALPLAHAAAPAEKRDGTLIDFRVEVQRSVANDLGRATAYVETTGSDPAEVARKVKATLAEGLATAKAQPGVTVRSGNTYTTPIYAKGNRSIETWRMRSELLLESRDAAALSAVVGRLQGTLAVGNLIFSPAPETRRAAEESATLEAIEAFRAKAERIAATLQKPYRIRQMSVNAGSHYPQPVMAMRSAAAAEAAPMPVEAGESNLGVNVSGQIELID